jgi:MFS family permease
VESTPAVILRALDGLGAGQARSVNSHRSDGLEHPASTAVSVAFAAALLAVLVALARAAARPPGDTRRLALASLAAVAAFAALGRVLSPQFLIWLVPLAALAAAWRLYALALATAGAIVLTLVEFPSRYFDLVAGERFPVAVVAVRDVLLLGVVGLAARALAGEQELLDRRRTTGVVGLDEHGVEPGVLV